MEKWEHATLGWFIDGRRTVTYWRLAGQDFEDLGDVGGLHRRMGEVGAQGWQLVTATISALGGETMYFKRRSSE